MTNTIEVTSAYTVTSTYEPPTTKATVFVPITLATSVPVTEVVTYPSERTETTSGGTVYVTSSYIVASTYTPPPVETTVPMTTATVVPPPPSNTSTSAGFSATTSAPLQVTSSGAQPTNKPIAVAVAGAMAFLAFV